MCRYDLAYVIAPQQRPTGTKGVAWVGAKGSMCNGCEAISDNFKVSSLMCDICIPKPGDEQMSEYQAPENL